MRHSFALFTAGALLCGQAFAVEAPSALVPGRWPVDKAAASGSTYPIQPVPFTAVRVKDGFWSPRIETKRQTTVWYDFKKCEETGRIDNFAKAAGSMPGQFRGTPWDDSDVYKVIEGAAYTLATHPDAKLDKYLEDLIANIAAAQEPDGYRHDTPLQYTIDGMTVVQFFIFGMFGIDSQFDGSILVSPCPAAFAPHTALRGVKMRDAVFDIEHGDKDFKVVAGGKAVVAPLGRTISIKKNGTLTELHVITRR